MRNYLKTKGKELKLTTLGFTLIELLAVIVVLAIIALIATPIVMNTIKNSKKGAAERSADNYVEQVETSLMTYRLENGENLPNGEYKITSDGNLCEDKAASCSEENKIKIEMNGTKPNGGKVVIKNSGVEKEDSFMFVGDYRTTYDTDNNTFTADLLEVLCTAVTDLSTQYVYNQGNIQTGVLASAGDPYAYGVEYTCELGDNDSKTFYVLENNEDTVLLIMNMNIDSNGKGTTSGNRVAWSSDGSNHKDEDESQQAVTAKEYLSSSTASWTKLNPNQISLPTYDQISQSYSGSMPTWLYENLYVNSSGGTIRGYWTSTPYRNSFDAWYAYIDGMLSALHVDGRDGGGVRPVITISKSQLG